MSFTPIEEIPQIRDTLKATFRSGVTKPIAWRRHQLLQLARMMQENAEALAESIRADLGRPLLETYLAEVGTIVERSVYCAEHLEEWTQPELLAVPDWQKSWAPTVHNSPKGTVLIIAPWNYPLVLSLQPLYGAISAGCCAVIKASEVAANFGTLLAKLFPKYLDQSAYRVVLGAVPEVTKLLELQWDHIFYTGNGHIGRIIATAAAKHLTPLTLELGGKSPVIVDSSFDLDLAAKRILWGKTNNAGQICVAPDFVLINRKDQDEFIAALQKHIAAFYPQGALQSDSFGRIVSEPHFARLKNVLSKTKGTIVCGGKTDDKTRGFEPTIVRDVKEGDSLLEGELFGPILPIVPVENLDQAIDYVTGRDHPLTLYAFTSDQGVKDKLLAETMSGSLVFNDTFQQLSVNEMPFGGVGESGYGRQVLKYSFENFVYSRGTIDVPPAMEEFLGVRYPPYTEEKFNILSAGARLPIPSS